METNSQKGNIQLELIIWIIISLTVGFRLIFAMLWGKPFMIFAEFYFDLLLTLIVLLFPFLFKLIYGEFPFQHIRTVRLKRVVINQNKTTELPKQNTAIDKEDKSETLDNTKTEDIIEHTVSELNIIEVYLKQSQKLSERIFSRSSAYLLIGCLIAFAGVIFFYVQSFYVKTTVTDFTELNFTIRETLPRIGVLIFVEAIAFFFLKQYKSTMEEFRYYEAIKRQRENQYLIANYVISNRDNIDDFTTIIDKLNLNDNPNKLSKDETTQLLENQKISVQESNFIEKLIDMLKIIRKE